MHHHMEIRFELATKPAVKGTMAMVSCVSIAYVATHAQNWYRHPVPFSLAPSVLSLEPTRCFPYVLLIRSKQ
jgi:hypothetical protein